jgi:hypothetical protein
VEYHYSIIWLKFLLRKFLKIFNIILTDDFKDTLCEIKPIIEALFCEKDSSEIYKTIMKKEFLSKYKVLNYKIVCNACSMKSKFKCLFCGLKNQNSFHSYAKCKITKYLI